MMLVRAGQDRRTLQHCVLCNPARAPKRLVARRCTSVRVRAVACCSVDGALAMMWMIRNPSGTYVQELLKQGVVGIGWPQVVPHVATALA
jgi:hypothetical protein